MATYIFSLGLIPVQEWIREARRSRDLRAGSVLLCHWMAKILARLPQGSTELIVPREPAGEPGLFGRLAAAPFDELLDTMRYGIPNRASGYFATAADGGAAEQEVRTVFAALQSEVLEADWRELKREHLGYRSGFRERDDREFWRSFESEAAGWRDLPPSIDCPVSLVWAAMPTPLPRERLAENLSAVDELYGSIKRWRPLRPWTAGAPVGKCTQCARREAIGPGDQGFDAWREWHRELEAQASVGRGYRLDPGERLCHVCWTRRMAGYAGDRRFPSTGEVAAAAWRRAVAGNLRLAPLLRDLERSDLATRDAGAALLASARELRERVPEEAEAILDRRAALRQAIERAHRSGEMALAPEPPQYLALMAFDGDDMGRRVQQYPKGMPAAMNEFAATAAARLDARDAAVFYLAGDEGLAMVPASAALAAARDLRRSFGEQVAPVDATATLSVGIAFFEHGRPMAGAARAARAALERCKELTGKDALGVTVSTASGSVWTFVARWGEAWERVQSAVELIVQGRLAAGWAYDVERLVAALPAGAWGVPDFLPAVEAEVRRLFFRRLAAEGSTAAERHAFRSRRWDELPGPGWWRPDAEGHAPRPQPEQFHLIGFLGRQGGGLPEGAATTRQAG